MEEGKRKKKKMRTFYYWMRMSSSVLFVYFGLDLNHVREITIKNKTVLGSGWIFSFSHKRRKITSWSDQSNVGPCLSVVVVAKDYGLWRDVIRIP